jgi:N-formylglutamate amidohydrolase
MDSSVSRSAEPSEALEILAPAEQTVPLVFASPHSGRDYPAAFLAQTALDPLTLRRSEDTYVDELFAAAPRLGAPLLRALFPRAFVDPNREPYELDPGMFRDPLPDYANIRSPRVAAGLGTLARVVANGAEIYDRRLPFAEAEHRIATCYRPYHSALQGLIQATVGRFGCCLLVDCHSMPSVGGPTDKDTGLSRVDFVLGDCFGSSCSPVVTATAEQVLQAKGWRVVRNAPYAGGFTTRHYGRPGTGVHALQIETNRRLYMTEATHTKSAAFDKVAADLTAMMAALAALPHDVLRTA